MQFWQRGARRGSEVSDACGCAASPGLQTMARSSADTVCHATDNNISRYINSYKNRAVGRDEQARYLQKFEIVMPSMGDWLFDVLGRFYVDVHEITRIYAQVSFYPPPHDRLRPRLHGRGQRGHCVDAGRYCPGVHHDTRVGILLWWHGAEVVHVSVCVCVCMHACAFTFTCMRASACAWSSERR